MLVKHSSSGYRAPPSTINPISAVSSRPAPFLRPPDIVTAALDRRLHFWVWGDSDSAPAGLIDAVCISDSSSGSNSSSTLSGALRNPAGFSGGVSGGARHYCSHPHYGHTGSIETMIEVPTNGGVIG
jgi:hypothetical protein